MYQATINIYNKSGEVAKSLHRQVPESWNELSREQLLQVMQAMLTIADKPRFELAIAGILLNLPMHQVILVAPAAIWQLNQKAAFITADSKDLTAQLLPWVKPPGVIGRRYFGPRERLRNLLFLEFIFADTFFIRYCQTQNEEILNRFIACLYREKTWFHSIKKRLATYNGDIRQRFNEHLVDARARRLAKLPMVEKMAILAWYRGCREELERLYEHVFSPGNQQEAGASGWDSVLRAISKDVFNIPATERIHIRNVLDHMEDGLILAEKQKQQNPNN